MGNSIRSLSSPDAALPSLLAPLQESIAPALLVPALAVGAISFWAWLDAWLKTEKPKLQMAATPFNLSVLSRCGVINSVYRPLPFLTNRHVETIFAAKTRATPPIKYRREILRTEDGGCATLDWEVVPDSSKELPADAPVLILLPGLTGGSGDSYIIHAVQTARANGIRAVVFNSRGTADSPVLTPQFYSASFTGDTRAVVAHVARQYPNSILLATGWSLGANILLRYLGEEGADTPLAAAVSMCNPFNLTISNANLTRGFNKVYDANLAQSLQRIFAKHELVWANARGGKLRPDDVPKCKTIREFDDAITIHSFGWASVDDYYAGSSSALSVPRITIPVLCIQALDDPIAPEAAIPYDALRENPNCVLVTTRTGGHLGWVAGEGAPFGAPWSDKAVAEWLVSVLQEFKSRGGPAQAYTARTSSPRQAVSVSSAAMPSTTQGSVSAPAPASADAVPTAEGLELSPSAMAAIAQALTYAASTASTSQPAPELQQPEQPEQLQRDLAYASVAAAAGAHANSGSSPMRKQQQQQQSPSKRQQSAEQSAVTRAQFDAVRYAL